MEKQVQASIEAKEGLAPGEAFLKHGRALIAFLLSCFQIIFAQMKTLLLIFFSAHSGAGSKQCAGAAGKR